MKFYNLCLVLISIFALPRKGLGDYNAAWQNLAEKFKTDKKIQESWAESVRIHNIDANPLRYNFTCDIEHSPAVPTSVHRLRPSDINVVAAIGDSITAGMGVGAETILDVPLQERGGVWCCGGDDSFDEGVYTIANIFKKFNPNLKGWSVGECSVSHPNSWMNRAVPGALSEDMVEQAHDLVQKFREDARINWENDWKFVNIFIGGNDLCIYCDDPEYRSPENFVRRIEDAIDVFHNDSVLYPIVPRVLVNILPIFDVTPLPSLSTGFICDMVHDFGCGCTTDEEDAPSLRPAQLEYFRLLENLINSGKYDDRDDFTVVMQTMTRDATPPTLPGTDEPDHSYWSPDCFHPSEKGHQGAAVSTWNTMLIPVGQKPYKTEESLIENISCPTQARPYIFTRLNSNASFYEKEISAEK